MNQRIHVVTGKRGAGKSNFCINLMKQAKDENRTTGGIISPSVYENGRKTAFFLMDAGTGIQQPCGTRTSGADGTIGCWNIDPAAITRGNKIIKTACPCDLLFIDELGPLEFEHGEGYTAAFDVLKHGNFNEAYVVVRPECIRSFQQHVPSFDVISIGEA